MTDSDVEILEKINKKVTKLFEEIELNLKQQSKLQKELLRILK